MKPAGIGNIEISNRHSYAHEVSVISVGIAEIAEQCLQEIQLLKLPSSAILMTLL